MSEEHALPAPLADLDGTQLRAVRDVIDTAMAALGFMRRHGAEGRAGIILDEGDVSLVITPQRETA